MTNFYEKVRRGQLEVAEGREVPNFQVQQSEQQEQPTTDLTDQAGQQIPTEELPSNQEVGEVEGEQLAQETNPEPLSAGKQPPRQPTVTTQQQDNPLPRPLNLTQGDIIELPDPDALTQTSEETQQLMPENQITTEEFQRKVEGAVPNPDQPTYAPEERFRQVFNTETFHQDINFELGKSLTQFSFDALNSASIDSPIVNALVNNTAKDFGLNFGTANEVGLFPSRYGTSFNMGQIDNQTPLGGADELDNASDFQSLEGLTQTQEQKQDATLQIAPQPFGQGFGQETRPEAFTEAKEFSIADTGFNARRQQDRKSGLLGRFSPGNIGRALGDGIQKMFSDGEGNFLQRFGQGFQKEFVDREITFDAKGNPQLNEVKETSEFIEPGIISTPIATLFNIATNKDKQLSDFGQEFNRIANKSTFGEQTISQDVEEGQLPFSTQTNSIFRGTAEVFSDLTQASTEILNLRKNGAPGQRFREEFANSNHTRAFLSQLGNEVKEDGTVEFNPMDGQFGEFGNGFLGSLNYTLNLPPNLIMAGVNKLWDVTGGSAVKGERVFEQALKGYDYMLTSPPDEQTSNITPIAKNKENREWWQWALAFGGDVFIGGAVDSALGRLIRGANAIQFTEQIAQRFPNKSFQFGSEVDMDFRPVNKLPNSGLRFDDDLDSDPWLDEKAGALAKQQTNNPMAFDQSPAQVEATRQDILDEKMKWQPQQVTKETNIKPTQVTDVFGNTVERETTIIQSVGEQPQAKIDYYGNPKKVVANLESDATTIAKEKGAFRFEENVTIETQARRLENTTANQRAKSDDIPPDANPGNATTFTVKGKDDDPRRLLPPMRAVQKAQSADNPVPNFENFIVRRDTEDLTQVAKAFGMVRRDRVEPLKPSEVKILREDFGGLFSFAGRPVKNSNIIQNPDARLAKELPNQSAGTAGKFVRRLPPAQEEPKTPKELERLGEPQRALEIRAEAMDAQRESLRINPVELAEQQQVESYKNMFNGKLRQLENDVFQIQNSESPTAVSKALERYARHAREYDELKANAPDRAVAEFEKETSAPREIERGSVETFTEKVASEREADNLASDARYQQAQADASHKFNRSRANTLKNFAEGMERESIEEEIAQIAYTEQADLVLEPASRETQQSLKGLFNLEASRITQNTYYHGTNVDLAELSSTDNMFAGIDPDVGGASTEIGVGVHLTDSAEIAEQYAQAMPPLNRPQLDDTAHLENGAVHKVGAKITSPIRADVKTESLPANQDIDVGDTVRKIFKKVGEAHAPSRSFATKFKRAVRKNRSIQQYFDQFRRQLAENGEMSEQRVRAFQRDVTRNLRAQGFDALYAKRGNEEVVNMLFPERIQNLSSNLDLPDATTTSRKQARKFVDQQVDVGLPTTQANRLQSEASLSADLRDTHLEQYQESAVESVKAQRQANEARNELAEETRAQELKDLEDAEQEVLDEAEDLVRRDWNPEEIIADVSKNQKQEAFFEEEDVSLAGINDEDVPDFGLDIPEGEIEILSARIDWSELLPEWHTKQLEKGGMTPQDLIQNNAVRNVDENQMLTDMQEFEAREILEDLRVGGVVEEVEEDLFALPDIEFMNLKLIMKRLKECDF